LGYSFVTSDGVLTASTNSSFLTVGRQRVKKCGANTQTVRESLVGLVPHPCWGSFLRDAEPVFDVVYEMGRRREEGIVQHT